MRLHVIITCVLVVVVSYGRCYVYEKCELANVLEKAYHMPKDEVKNWVCIAEYESGFNTSDLNRINPADPGHYDYGLFHINSHWWCSARGSSGYNICNMTCEDFLDDDLKNDLICAKTIQKKQGYEAWASYPNSCQDIDNYIAECYEKARL